MQKVIIYALSFQKESKIIIKTFEWVPEPKEPSIDLHLNSQSNVLYLKISAIVGSCFWAIRRVVEFNGLKSSVVSLKGSLLTLSRLSDIAEIEVVFPTLTLSIATIEVATASSEITSVDSFMYSTMSFGILDIKSASTCDFPGLYFIENLNSANSLTHLCPVPFSFAVMLTYVVTGQNPPNRNP